MSPWATPAFLALLLCSCLHVSPWSDLGGGSTGPWSCGTCLRTLPGLSLVISEYFLNQWEESLAADITEGSRSEITTYWGTGLSSLWRKKMETDSC